MQRLDYPSYWVFIGVYPNDQATQEAAYRLAAEHDNLRVVITKNDGPTCKADCVNTIIANIREFEQEHSISFVGFLMQDAEDILNPNTLSILNASLELADVVQLPVLSVPRHRRLFTAGHYMDEFAEFHSKELIVRGILTGTVPGAGVGTCYSKKTIETAQSISGSDKNGIPEIFNTASLTEDYDLSMRLTGTGLKHILLWIHPSKKKRVYELCSNAGDVSLCLLAKCASEDPMDIGISFQGWSELGWKGGLAAKYFFWRDRKMIFFSHAIVIGYVAIFVYWCLYLYVHFVPDAYNLPPLLPEDSPFWYVIWFIVLLLAHRLIQRHIWTGYHYGLKALLPVIPRYFLSVFINYFAMVRAIKAWIRHLATGEVIGWDKTAHDYPEEESQTPPPPVKRPPRS